MASHSSDSSPATRYAVVVVACLTLGLAPFVPQPHLLGKLRWIVGGASGMSTIDWLDLAFHGAPWGVLIVMASVDLRRWVSQRLGRRGGSRS